ncbi:hypothetical protein [Streptomyces albogriseolus]|uniref:hypothetical protein n=1 Tax=Streptomyces albogriseolus TaxID=1887 RepID=UPI003CECAD3C
MTNSKPLPRRGRPPLLTADLIKDIAAAAEQGMNRRQIATAVKVGYASLMRWLADGRRLRDAGVDGSALMGHEWLCLRLVKCVEDAEKARRANNLEALDDGDLHRSQDTITTLFYAVRKQTSGR